MDFDFHWKYNEFEIRTIQTHYIDTNKTLPYIELVKWIYKENEKPYCFTLAYYKWDSEGGELIFVGNRPFEFIAEIDIQIIWKQLWLACKMLQDVYEKERRK